MAAFTALAIGAALGAGMLLGRKGRKKPDGIVAPGPTDTQAVPKPTPAEQVAQTRPVYAVASESANTKTAQTVAARTRRRAAAGGVDARRRLTLGQSATFAASTPRTLIGS